MVIDVETGDVKALVSYPDYDLNGWDKLYPSLVQDNLRCAPLRNRATQSMFEPGSTVKPVVGAGAITQGLLGVNEGIECTGYLKTDGRTYKGFGKCWTVAVALKNGLRVDHHTFPSPHQGHDGNSDGFLTYSRCGTEQSCNNFFETVAYRLKLDGLSYWMRNSLVLAGQRESDWRKSAGDVAGFVYGPESSLCNLHVGHRPKRGGGNAAANVQRRRDHRARRGIWMRPNIVKPGYDIARYRPKNIPAGDSDWDDIPSRMDLHIAPAAIDAAFDGMKRAVNGPLRPPGTGTTAFCDLVTVAGKTGTAQASPFLVAKLDENNHPIPDADGKPIREPLNASTHENPDPNHPWYRSTDDTGKMLNHAWFIGFVPADHPKYAISVMVEYGGGGGGVVAGPIARKIVYALIAHQYLQPETRHSAKEPLD